jgi:hypothetical protein
MKRAYAFKSLSIVPDPSGETQHISYNMESARDHVLNVQMRDFVLCRTWIMNFFISLMTVSLVSALIYGVLVIAVKANMGSGSVLRSVLPVFMALACIALWLFLGIPSAIRRLKMELVTRERGQGNWKIIDEKDWEHFCRIVKIADERRKKLSAEARKKVFEK